jgi:putative PEP-CTERM system TPR-repeat lipoprotein
MEAKFWWVWLAGIALVAALSGCSRTTPDEHVARARGFVERHDLRSAVIELKSALQKDPNLAAARLALGEVDLQIGDFASAQKELERALDLGADKTRVMPPLLEAKLEFGRYQEVLGALESLDSSPRLDVVRGRALLMSGAVPDATAAFRKAIATEPSSTAYIGLAQIALATNDSAEAKALLAKAVEVDPKGRRAWLAQGDLLSILGQLDDALASFKTAAQIPGGDLLPELGIVRVQILQGNLDDASASVDGVLSRAPADPMANYFKGLIAFQNQDYATAEKALRTVQQQAPDHPPTLLLLGTVKFRQGQLAEADSQISRFLTFQPDNISARRLLAAVRLSNKNPSGAVDALEPVAARLKDAQGLALLGTAYLRSGAADKATAYLQQAVEISPDQAVLRNQLALSMIAGGDTQNAIAQLETAVHLDDNLTQSDMMLVLLRLKEGKFDQAIAAASALTIREPKSPIGFNLLGVAELAKKDEANAIAAFEKALAVDPGYSPAVLNLAKVALANGDSSAARARLKRLLERDPVDVTALSALAQIAANERDWAAAKDYLERARSAHADALPARIALARLALATNDPELAQTVSAEAVALDTENVDALTTHAQALITLGNAAQAEPDVNKLDTLVSKSGASTKSLLAVAVLQHELGALDRARTNLQRAVAQSPDSVEALIALVRVEASRGDEVASAALLDRLAKLHVDPATVALLNAEVNASTGNLDAAVQGLGPLAKQGNREATLRLADALSRDGKNTDAKRALQAYLSVHPDDFGVEVALAGVILEEGNRNDAIGRYEKLNAKRADSPVVLNNLAWLYFEANDQRAEETARHAYAVAPRNPQVADTLGWILIQQGDADAAEALRYLESAAGARPDDASINYHLAAAYEKLNRRTEARHAVDRSLKSSDFPEKAEAVALRGRL